MLTVHSVGLATRQGQRPWQQDRGVLLAFDGKRHRVAFVCDGISGAPGGEEAARICTETVEKAFLDGVNGPFGLESALEFVEGVCDRGQDAVRSGQMSIPMFSRMGTTCCGFWLRCEAEHAVWFHIGDSLLLHRTKEGALRRLGVDHTVAQVLVQQKLIRPEAVKDHPLRSTLVLYVGCEAYEENGFDIKSFSVKAGDQLLACTDGAVNRLTDEDIQEALTMCVDAQSACERLLDLAEGRGEHDNMTMAAIWLQ
jgi:protein phosphatase